MARIVLENLESYRVLLNGMTRARVPETQSKVGSQNPCLPVAELLDRTNGVFENLIIPSFFSYGRSAVSVSNKRRSARAELNAFCMLTFPRARCDLNLSGHARWHCAWARATWPRRCSRLASLGERLGKLPFSVWFVPRGSGQWRRSMSQI